MQRRHWIECGIVGALLAALACLVLARCLPSGMAPVSVDPLYSAPDAVPFAEVRPADYAPSHPFVSDTAMVFEPWLEFMAREVAAGALPLWSPLSGGGLPMMGNLSSALFSPFTWWSLAPGIGAARGMFFAALCKLLVAGIGGYLLLRRLGGGPAARLAGAVGFMLFGYQVVWLNYSLTNVSCLLPIALWAADRFAERTSAGRGFGLAFVLAVQFLGGHAETSLALGIAVVLWLATHGGIPLLLKLAPWGVLALALCSFQLLPFIEYLSVSQGRAERLGALPPAPVPPVALLSPLGCALAAGALAAVFLARRALAASDGARIAHDVRAGIGGAFLFALAIVAWNALGMRPLAALLLDPAAFGDPTRGGTYVGPEAFPDVNGGYVGVVLLACAVLYVLVAANRRRVAFVIAATAIGLGFPLAIEPLHSALRSIPPFDLAASTRLFPLFACGAIIAGASALDEFARDRSRASCVARRGVIAAVGALILAWAVPDSSRSDPAGASATNESAVTIAAPEHGQRFHPGPDGRGGSVLRIEIRGRVGGERTTDDVRIAIGDGFLDTKCRADGSFAVTWNATRAEPGAYPIVARSGTRQSAPCGIEIVRGAHISLAAWLRIALALAVVAVVLRNPSLSPLAPVAIACELYFFGEPYNPATPVEQVFPRTAVTDFLAAEEAAWRARGDGPFRVLCEDVILQPNMNHAYGLQVVRAYDQLEFRPFRALLLEWVGDVPFVRYNRDTIALTHPLCDLLNVAYVVTSAPLEREGYELAFASESGRAGRVYRNRNALRRAFLVEDAIDRRSVPREQLIAFDPRKTAFLEQSPPTLEPTIGTVRFIEYHASRVEIAVESTRPSLLVSSDNDYPGWVCEVNGSATPIQRTHLALRAVAVPAGSSRVVFEYRPATFRVGIGLAALACAVGFGALVVSRRRKSTVR